MSAKSVAILIALTLVACGGGGVTVGSSPGGNAELLAVHHGLLVDVYGLRDNTGGLSLSLFQTDVLIGPDIRDEREAGKHRPDEEIFYDFINANPDTLQPRLLIPREIDSAEFRELFEALDHNARLVAPAQFGQSQLHAAFSMVPRNAGIRLTFTEGLGVDDDFFVARDEDGKIVGVRNSEAVQLLEIVGDPTDLADAGDFQVIPTRVAFAKDGEGNVVHANQLIVDPVLLGGEGLEYQTRNNASGMPEAPDQIGANIRIAVALEGPLAIPGVREDSVGNLTGRNNAGRRSVIRDMRSGNRLDFSRGFIPDAVPPRIIGQMLFFVVRVDDVDQFAQDVTLFKNGVIHEIDRGDVLHFVDVGASEAVPAAITEVIVDPLDDRGRPERQYVRVRVRRVAKVNDIDPIEALDPSSDPGYPQDPQQRKAWLVRNAARAFLVAEFTASQVDPETETLVRDDPRNFISFSPTPLPNADGTPSNPSQNVSPFAGAIIRFNKPVDLTAVNTTDSLFFATRNLLDPDEIERFKAAGGRGPGSKAIDPLAFRLAKFRTPHLLASRLFDEDGSQTTLRLQPILGFYLDDKVREDQKRDFDDKKYNYYLHVLSGLNGITDLSGNPIDFQAEDVEDSGQIVIPFSLDTRMRNSQDPVFPDNIVASIVRTYDDVDEDEQPSYYQAGEFREPEQGTVANAESVPDIFGAVIYSEDGTLRARPTTRARQIVDNLNQALPPRQDTVFRWCPVGLAGYASSGQRQEQIATNTGAVPFGQGIQNPLNPFGCRLQTVWREIDMSLSRVDPFDFNLDVEQMYWAPFTGRPIRYDEFDRVSMFLAHSEWRPEPCVGTDKQPSMWNSGLRVDFASNYLNNPKALSGGRESAPPPHPAYVDATMVIDPNQAITEPHGINRFLPLPTFQKPFFVWRDETVMEQGGNSGRGGFFDVDPTFTDYIISPFLGGHGRKVTTGQDGSFNFTQGTWSNANTPPMEGGPRDDSSTGGLLGAIALPLMADFWTYCDSPSLPAGNGFIAAGSNGWQISVTVQNLFNPAFRAYSGGFSGFGAKPPECVDPSSLKWATASGGFTPTGDVAPTVIDNSIYWIMADFLKRTTVATAGFVDITNPHRVPNNGSVDPRLGPYFGNNPPADVLPTFSHDFQPPLELLPAGTSVVVEFRGASIVDPVDPTSMNSGPWRARKEGYDPVPNETNFPLDPLKAGDAHIRKFDDRPSPFTGGAARNWWTYFYNRTVTSYTEDLNTLMDPRFTGEFAGPFEVFRPRDVKYFNWRFLMTNDVDAQPPVSPSVDTFMVTYRFEQVR